MPTYRLTELEIDRIDLVDKGANPEAHVTLFKRAGGRLSGPVAVPASLAKVGTYREGASSVSKGIVPHVVISNSDDPAEWASKLSKIAKLRADDSLQVSGDERTTRALLALIPDSFDRHAMLSAPGLGAGRGPAVVRKGVSLAEWDAMWARREAIWKTEIPAPAEVPIGDAARPAFQRLVTEIEHQIRQDDISPAERHELAMRGDLSTYEQALILAERRNPALWIAYSIATL